MQNRSKNVRRIQEIHRTRQYDRHGRRCRHGGAVTTVVNSIVNSVINPFIAMIFGKPNMDGLLAITFNGATVSFGAVLGAILNFLIIAVAVYFCILVPINKFRDMTEALLAKTKLAEQKEAEEKAAEEPSPKSRPVPAAAADS